MIENNERETSLAGGTLPNGRADTNRLDEFFAAFPSQASGSASSGTPIGDRVPIGVNATESNVGSRPVEIIVPHEVMKQRPTRTRPPRNMSAHAESDDSERGYFGVGWRTWLWLAICGSLIVITWPTPNKRPRRTAGVAPQGISEPKDEPPVRIQVSAHPVATQKSIPIQHVKLGERVAGRNPLRDQVEDVPDPDADSWRELRLQMRKDNGLTLWIDLLRPQDWVEFVEAKVGATIFLDLPEMGAVGDAEVTYVGPCPEICKGTGPVVTGRFIHDSDGSNVVHLHLEGDTKPTGVTDNHLFWSVDRQDFVPAGELRPRERIDSTSGTQRVVSVQRIAYTGKLYNLETHREHVFRVGEFGVLVHNFCLHRVFTDAVGRTRAAVARITLADLGTGTGTNAATRAAARGALDTRWMMRVI